MTYQNNANPVVVDFGGSNIQTLQCPDCKQYNLHHFSVEISDRCEEDSFVGNHIKTTQNHVIFDIDAETNNPSARRDGLKIFFICEHCDDIKVLNISQHKGATFVEWDKNIISRELLEINGDGYERCGGI